MTSLVLPESLVLFFVCFGNSLYRISLRTIKFGTLSVLFCLHIFLKFARYLSLFCSSASVFLFIDWKIDIS